MRNNNLFDLLGKRFPALAGTPSLADAIAEHAQLVTLPSGKAICFEGDDCTHLALITAGTARVFKLAESGREITLYRIESGECCILTASCMLSGRVFPAIASVENELQAILIPKARVKAWMQTHEVWRRFLWDLLAERLGDVISLIEEVAFRRMDRRLADYLVEQTDSRGPLLRATHQQIAADLGTSREVVSRMLKDFQLRGTLDLARGRIKIHDLDDLRRIGHECD